MDEIIVGKGQLASAAQVLAQKGATLLTMVATDERHRGNGFVVRYIFGEEGRLVTLLAQAEAENPTLPSVTPDLPLANWYEREAHDLLGIVFEGHPDPRPLVYHGAWPAGSYPLRKDFRLDGSTGKGPAGGGYEFQKDDISGVMEVPVGPIHAGIIEPGHFRFTAVGEEVNRLEARLFFTHRGVEKTAEGMDVNTGMALAERICGACSFSHSFSYAQAVEEALGLTVSRRTNQLRTVLMELERLYNHVGDLGNICAGTGFAFGISHFGRLKERLMALNEQVTGNRFLRGLNKVGGLRHDLSTERISLISSVTDEVMSELPGIVEKVLESDAYLDRINGTGKLEKAVAQSLGVVGVAARASGLDIDSRRDYPHGAYAETAFEVPTLETADVAARIRIRVEEVYQSKSIIEQILAKLAADGVGKPGPVKAADAADGSAARTGLGISESARGSNVHWIMLDGSGRIERLRVRSASFSNWPAVPTAVPGNIVPDFPLINKSFELCYSCLDR